MVRGLGARRRPHTGADTPRAYPPDPDEPGGPRPRRPQRCWSAPTPATRPPARRWCERFLPLARQLARRYQRGGELLDDLNQVASLGLLKAIDRFDPERETAFSSFAVPTILGELKRHFRDKGWSVRVPRDLQELAVRLEPRERGAGPRAGPRAPRPAEIAERTGTTLEQVLEAREAAGAYRAVSLDRPRDDDEDDGGIGDRRRHRGPRLRRRRGLGHRRAPDAGAERPRARGAAAALRART